ncbi:hypothetical protein MJN76_30790, partial [Salmonella enterica subsp. enterica serovar Anatum]|nr:hypothetical protein [Salmonella enterica subsp. enterica serovar Anatum]
ADCKSAVIDFEGSNPSPTTIIHYIDVVNSMSNAEVCTCRGRVLRPPANWHPLCGKKHQSHI